ncbi:MAG TPA: RES family NAD+ phosphorylase [Candidatus Kapabacteria bacterium]|nr:RES family NAD+ phosphorylase [Candidatus Kapabacteria bacterium]
MAKRPLGSTAFNYIARLGLPVVKRGKGEVCFRIHRTVHDPLWFGPDTTIPVSGRFNAPDCEYGVCYFGTSFDVAFAETLLRNPANRLLSSIDLAKRSVSTGHLIRQIRLVQLHGAGLNRLRISAETVHGAHDVCRQLALALWEHPQKLDGIAYRSRFDNDELCFALFDRAGDAVAIDTTEGLMDDAHRLARTLDKYDVGLDP